MGTPQGYCRFIYQQSEVLSNDQPRATTGWEAQTQPILMQLLENTPRNVSLRHAEDEDEAEESRRWLENCRDHRQTNLVKARVEDRPMSMIHLIHGVTNIEIQSPRPPGARCSPFKQASIARHCEPAHPRTQNRKPRTFVSLTRPVRSSRTKYCTFIIH